MSRKTYEGFGALANSKLSATRRAGRYAAQAEGEKKVPPDVVRKLALTPNDTLFDVGCGPGKIARALAPKVKSIVAMDHPLTIDRLRKERLPKNVSLLAGEFPDTKPARQFSKIMAYSMIQCVSSETAVIRFVDEALSLLKPGGRMLIADLSNVDRRERFNTSPAGRRFAKTWATLVKKGQAPWIEDPERPTVNDAFVMRLLSHCRAKGLDAWVMPQPPDLPFGRTREDVLIEKPG